MKKTFFTLFLALCTFSCAMFSQKTIAEKTIVATYNKGQITLAEAQLELEKIASKSEKLKDIKFSDLKKDQQELIIKEMVLQKIVYQEAKKMGFKKEKSYEKAVKNFKQEFLKQKLYNHLVSTAKTQENVQKNYKELLEKSKNKFDFKISYIAVDNQKKAEEIYQKLLKNPSNFAKQAKQSSIDAETAKKGGNLGFVFEDNLPASLVENLKQLKKNQITKPIAVVDSWFIVQLQQTRKAEILPFEKAKEQLAENLAKLAVEDFIEKSLEQAKINIK
jgi:parvulin-like peptidyl-prolyl isomerase